MKIQEDLRNHADGYEMTNDQYTPRLLRRAADRIEKLEKVAEAAKSLEHVMDNSEDVQFSLCEMRVYDAFKYALSKLEELEK